jgi:hypothetical protein
MGYTHEGGKKKYIVNTKSRSTRTIRRRMKKSKIQGEIM